VLFAKEVPESSAPIFSGSQTILTRCHENLPTKVKKAAAFTRFPIWVSTFSASTRMLRCLAEAHGDDRQNSREWGVTNFPAVRVVLKFELITL